jgi:predicted GNAT family acetyltransferase
MDEIAVSNHEAASRFELTVEGETALLQYRLRPGTIVFLHMEVPGELEGRGLGSRLARAGLDYAREHGLKVVPLCPFVTGYIKRHPEYLDLVEPSRQSSVAKAVD